MKPPGAMGTLLRALGRRDGPDTPPAPHSFREKALRRRGVCAACGETLGPQGLVCRVCKIISHKRCEAKVTSSCQAPPPPEMRRNTTPARRSEHLGSTKSLSSSRQRNTLPRPPSPELPQELELRYVSERILSLQFPGGTGGPRYRRHLRLVAQGLLSRHRHQYTIFNLSEKRRDIARLNPKVQDFGWPDLHAPPLDRLCSICKAMEGWLRAHPQHVAVLHCKGSKGKTGVVVAAYMHYSKVSASAEQALSTLAMKKFCEETVAAELQPSQKRYICYFSSLLSGRIRMQSSPQFLHHVLLPPLPHFQLGHGYQPFLKIYQSLQLVYTSGIYSSSGPQSLCVTLEPALLLKGDVMVKCYHHRGRGGGREPVFRVQFHTGTLPSAQLVLGKDELDLAWQDDRFPVDATVEFIFSTSPEKIKGCPPPSIPIDYGVGDPTVRWDSYEGFNLRHEDSLEELPHTQGPLDGSPYAQVQKKEGASNPWTSGKGCSNPPSPPSTPPTSHGSSRPPPTAAERQELEQLLGGFGVRGGTPGLEVGSEGGPPHPSHITPLAQGTPVSYGATAPYSSMPPHGTTTSYGTPLPHRTPTSHGAAAPHGTPQSSHEIPTSYGATAPYSTPTPHSTPTSRGTSGPYGTPQGTPTPYGSPTSHGSPTSCGSPVTFGTPPSSQGTPISYGTPPSSHGSRRPSHGTPISYGTPPSSQGTLTPYGPPSVPVLCRRASLAPPCPCRYHPAGPRYGAEGSLERPGGVPETPGGGPKRGVQRSLSEGVPHSGYGHRGGAAGGYLLPEELPPSALCPCRDCQGCQGWGGGREVATVPQPAPSLCGLRLERGGPEPAWAPGEALDPPVCPRCGRPGLGVGGRAAPPPPRDLYGKVGCYDNPLGLETREGHGIPGQLESRERRTPGEGFPWRSPPAEGPSLRRPLRDPESPEPPASSSRGGLPEPSRHPQPASPSSSSSGSSTHGCSPLPAFPPPALYYDPSPPQPPFPDKRPPTTAPGGPRDPASPPPRQATFSPAPTAAAATQDFQQPPSSGGTPYGYQEPTLSQPDATAPMGGVPFVQDTSKFWYKPGLSRDQAVQLLKGQEPGSFLIRLSSSFQGSYGLALRVAAPPSRCGPPPKGDPQEQLVRHFLIETGPRGVKIKGSREEPHFGSLPALVLHHSISPISLPCALRIPSKDPVEESLEVPSNMSTAGELLRQGAACRVLLLGSLGTESLTGPQAVAKAAGAVLGGAESGGGRGGLPRPPPCTVQFKVSAQGITLTDSLRKLFFRRHYPVSSVTYCSTDPQDRRWANADGTTSTIFGFVAKEPGGDNWCHVFAELDPEQPAGAIVAFVTKVMLGTLRH